MPQVVVPKSTGRKLVPLVAFIVVAVAIVAAVGGYIAWRLIPSAASTAAKVNAENAQGISYGSNYAVIKSAYDRAIFKSDKILLLSPLAAASEDNGNDQQALVYYQDLNNLQPNQISTLSPLIELTDQLGSKELEITYAKQAIVLLKAGPQKAQTKAQISGLKSQIAELSQ